MKNLLINKTKQMNSLINTTIISKIQLSSFFAMIASFLLPIKFIMITVGLFIAADTAIGIFKAKRKQEKITSRKLSNVISKLLLYQGAVVTFFLLEQFILQDFIALFLDIHLVLTKFVGALLVFIELQSVNEHIESLTGKGIWTRAKEMITRAKEIKEEVGDLKDNNGPDNS